MLSSARIFHENSLIVGCCTFGKLEIRILTPNRFKNQFSGTLKLLAHNFNHQQGLAKQKLSLSIIVVLNQNFLNTFIKIAILGKIYQCNSYSKFEQHWIKFQVSTVALLSTFLITKSQPSPFQWVFTLQYFRQVQNQYFNTKQIKK